MFVAPAFMPFSLQMKVKGQHSGDVHPYGDWSFQQRQLTL